MAIVATAIRLYGGQEGVGLFEGVSRYAVLQGRLRQAAETTRDVRMMWDRLASAMRWPITASKHDDVVLALIAPSPEDADVLRALADRSDSVIRLARQVARRERAGAPREAPPPPIFDDPLDVFGTLNQPSDPAPSSIKPEAQSDIFGASA